VLRSKEFKYLNGLTSYWPPEWPTTLVYDGNAEKLHAFIAALNKVGGVTVRLTFSRDLSKETGSALSAGSWWVKYSHTTPDTITVRINLAAESLGRDQFELRLPKKESASENQNRGAYEWENKPQLSPDQDKLVRLLAKLEDAADATRRSELEEQVTVLKARLGEAAVRPARANELILSQEASGRSSVVYNPSADNVAFTVSIKGDEEWLGSRKGSIGRQTYLPPKTSLIVRDLYWTTPSMARKD
jgi:hypothetical protein